MSVLLEKESSVTIEYCPVCEGSGNEIELLIGVNQFDESVQVKREIPCSYCSGYGTRAAYLAIWGDYAERVKESLNVN